MYSYIRIDNIQKKLQIVLLFVFIDKKTANKFVKNLINNQSCTIAISVNGTKYKLGSSINGSLVTTIKYCLYCN